MAYFVFADDVYSLIGKFNPSTGVEIINYAVKL